MQPSPSVLWFFAHGLHPFERDALCVRFQGSHGLGQGGKVRTPAEVPTLGKGCVRAGITTLPLTLMIATQGFVIHPICFPVHCHWQQDPSNEEVTITQ